MFRGNYFAHLQEHYTVCYSLWYNAPTMLPAGGRQNRGCPKHVELTGIINKSLLLHLVGCLYYLYQ